MWSEPPNSKSCRPSVAMLSSSKKLRLGSLKPMTVKVLSRRMEARRRGIATPGGYGHQRYSVEPARDHGESRCAGRSKHHFQHARSTVQPQLRSHCRRSAEKRHESVSLERLRILSRYVPEQWQLLLSDHASLSPERFFEPFSTSIDRTPAHPFGGGSF
jgi:hypothetical protein